MVDGYGISANVKRNYARNITVDGCTFTGTNGTNYDYGMILHSVYDIVVKNTTGANLYDLVYGRGSVNGFTAENGEIINSKNGIWLTYPDGKITFTNVTTAGIEGAGVGFKNNAIGTATFNNCDIDRIEYSEEGTKALKLIFNDTENNLMINDQFGHKYLSGTGKALEIAVKNEIGCKVRSVELNICQRCAAHVASAIDLEESVAVGRAAVKHAAEGVTREMMTIDRISTKPYAYKIGHNDIDLIANPVKTVPAEFINEAGNDVTDACVEYLLPLIAGEVAPAYKDGLPVHVIID